MNTNPQTEREVYQTVPFTFEGQLVRVVIYEEKPWFIAQDIGKVFGYKGRGIFNILHTYPKNESHSRFIDDEKVVLMSIKALNTLIFHTRNPVAEDFNLWLLNEFSFFITQIDADQADTHSAIRQLKSENDYLQKRLLEKNSKKPSKDYKVTSLEKTIILKSKMVDCLPLDEISRITGLSEEIIYNTLMEAANE